MRSFRRQRESLGWGLFSCGLILLLGVGLACSAGCRPSESPPSGPPSETPPAGGGDVAPSGQPGMPGDQPAGPSAKMPGVQPSADVPGAGQPVELGDETAARKILQSMVEAYQTAKSYDDKGFLAIRYAIGDQPPGEPYRANLGVTLKEPNKFRLQAYGGVVVCDGEKLWGAVMNNPEQMLQREAPAEATLEAFFFNHVVGGAMIGQPTRSFSWLPPQLILLLADDPLKTFLHEAQQVGTLPPQNIDEHTCDRVGIRRDDGTAVCWIDQETRALRRFEYPSEFMRAMVAQREQVPPSQVHDLMLVAEMAEAKFGGEIQPEAFEFETPPEVEMVENFTPKGFESLGKKVPEFSFVDLEGNAITPESLAGKIAVIDVWATWCGPCKRTLPDVEQVYQQYKDNEKVAFLAVSTDEADVSDQKLRDTFSEIGVNIPIARDPENTAYKALGVDAYPTQLIIDAEGVLQFRQAGGDQPGTGAPRLVARVEKLLAGEDLYSQITAEYEQAQAAAKQQFEAMLQWCLEEDLYVVPPQEAPVTDIAERAEPKSLKITQLWSCTELAAPGNVLVVPRPDEPPRVLVLGGGEQVAEIAPKGNVVSTKTLELPRWKNPQGQLQQESVFFLRTAVGDDGKRYFAGSALGVQQVHVWDEQLKLVTSYPEDAFESPHAGIADVCIADFDGDGTLSLAVSYLGVVGVQGVSLEGERLWANKKVVLSLRLVVLGPDAEKQRSLLAFNSSTAPKGELVVLDPAGVQTSAFSFPDRVVAWMAGADLDDDGTVELCAMTALPDGNLEAVGFDREGQILWKYALPRGMHQHQIEAVLGGQLLPEPPAQWLLTSADGTIHVVDASGNPIDTFSYGKTITGVATAQWDDKRVLLVSTPEAVDAWQVEPAAAP